VRSGVAAWGDQTVWDVGLSANWPDITLPIIQDDIDHMYDSGTIPFLHAMFKPATSAPYPIVEHIRRGDYDWAIETWLTQVLQYVGTGRKCVIVPYPEMNGPWVAYGPDRNNFRAKSSIDIYRNFVEKGKAMGLRSDEVLWCWAPNDVGWGKTSDYWPGNDVVDIVGGSAYNWGGLTPGEPWETPAQVIDPYVTMIRRLTDKPIIVTQTGAGEGDTRTPQWLDDLTAYTQTGIIDGFIWFSISEFTYQPGPADFNSRVAGLDSSRPDEWFQEATMPYPDRFPTATWVGSKMPGKPWRGVTQPVVVLHTLEFNGWPDPQRWDSPSHLVANPNTGELRQYLPMDRAAYSVRDNALEDDKPTWQVEMWGKAANVPNYSDDWYRGVAELVNLFNEHYQIPVTFADFTNVQYGKYAPARMTDAEVRAFTGFLGHAHMGRGTDSHWDPGKLDVTRVLQFAGGVHEPPPGGYQMRTVQYGDGTKTKRDATVAAAQRAMTIKGYRDDNTIDDLCGADGIFRSGTRLQTERFQTATGIPVTGIVDDETWTEIDKEQP